MTGESRADSHSNGSGRAQLAPHVSQRAERARANGHQPGSHRAHSANSTRLDPDRELLAALRRGEPTAAEALIAAYGDRAYRLALRITGKPHDGEEAVQDA